MPFASVAFMFTTPPLRLVNARLVAFTFTPFPNTIVPLLFQVLLTGCAPPEPTVVVPIVSSVPAPLIVALPDQLKLLFTVIAPLPFSVPPLKVRLDSDAAPPAVNAPLLTCSVPPPESTLWPAAVSEPPPLICKVSLPMNLMTSGVGAAPASVMVRLPVSSGTNASSPVVGAWPRLQLPPVFQSPPPAIFQLLSVPEAL